LLLIAPSGYRRFCSGESQRRQITWREECSVINVVARLQVTGYDLGQVYDDDVSSPVVLSIRDHVEQPCDPDLQSSFLPTLSNGRTDGILIIVHEASWEGPSSLPRLPPTPNEQKLAVSVGQRTGCHFVFAKDN
jgi:hypothetical protein